MEGEGLSTDELFTQAFAQLRQLKNRAVNRRGRDKAMELTTELFLSIDGIARHVGALSFTERPVAVEDDEDDEVDERMSMAELMHPGAGGEDLDDLPQVEDVEELRAQNDMLRKGRLSYFQDFLDYLAKGCKHEGEITRKALACIRRVRPQILVRLGLSQADVARKLGEVRATVSAREKREVEKLLKQAGARGVLGNGARGAGTSAACAKAARGNKNRKLAAKQPDRLKVGLQDEKLTQKNRKNRAA
jgi:hypothetical protein